MLAMEDKYHFTPSGPSIDEGPHDVLYLGLNRFAVVLWDDLHICNLRGSIWWQPPTACPWSDDSIARRCGGAMWRCSSRTGVADEPASPSHDRGHANPQPDAEHAARVC